MKEMDFKNIPWKAFVISFIITFLVSTLYKANLFPHYSFNSPSNKTVIETGFEKIKPLLQKKKNSYKLNEQGSLIKGAYASSTNIDSSSYLLLNFDTGEVISEKNMKESLPIASLTKIMTAVVALDLADPNEEFSVSKNAASQIPTKIGVSEGEKIKLKDLLESALLTSANDGTEVIREGINKKYNDQVFVKAMNQKAKFLGLSRTSFNNPQGFDAPDNYSSSEDLAVLSHYAIENYPLIRGIVEKEEIILPSSINHKRYDLQNWNGLVGVYPGAKGIKIGNTDAAGTTTVVLAEREDKKILAIVLGAPGIMERDSWAAALLDQGFERYGIPKAEITEEILNLKYSSWKYWN